MKLSIAILAVVTVLSAADVPLTQVPVSLTDEKGSFTGSMSVSLDGKMDSVKVKWNGTIKNTSPHRIFRVTLCFKAFDAAGKQITAGEEQCVLRLYGTNWNPALR